MAKKKKTPPPPATPEDTAAEILAEMDREFHESPDRVIAIVGAAYLDSLLDRLFRAVFIGTEEQLDRLLRPDAPLGSNGARYNLAYSLGLISQDQYDDLKTIATIRNKFAHEFKARGFQDAPFRDHCASLKQPRILEAMPAQLFESAEAEMWAQHVRETSATPREKFRTSVFALFGSLFRRLTYVRRAEPSAWFSYDPDALMGPPAEG